MIYVNTLSVQTNYLGRFNNIPHVRAKYIRQDQGYWIILSLLHTIGFVQEEVERCASQETRWEAILGTVIVLKII